MTPKARVACAVLALALGCSKDASWPPSPAELVPGEDACAECRMLVSDPRFAVQVHARGGGVQWFDDLGCVLARDEAVQPEAVFVRDFTGDAWVRGDQGHAVRVPGLHSPMGYGWTVYAAPSEARAAASAEGARLSPLSEMLLGRPSDGPRPDASANENPSTSRR